jgi:hypothetical protein
MELLTMRRALVDAAPPPLTQCAWCNAIQIDGVYHRCPAIPLLDSSADNVSHGICPGCFDAEMAKLRLAAIVLQR